MEKESRQKTLIIIDSNAVIHRSYHALPPLTSPKGELVNAAYGFASLLIRVLRELKPDYVAAAFDLAGPTFRHKAYKEYKATRIKAPDELYAQIPLVKKILEAFHIPVFEKQGYEADDVIGTIAKHVRGEAAIECIIVTGDLDTLQLVDPKTRVYTLKSGLKESLLYGNKEVENRFGISPVQIPDFKGLKGDPSDNIPGVPGIGEKTASLLLQKFGTLEKLYEFLDSSEKNATAAASLKKPLTEKLVAQLREYRDQAFFSKELATINCNTPLEFSLESAHRASYSREDVVALFRELGFLSLVERLSASEEGASERPPDKKLAAAVHSAPDTKPLDETFLRALLAKKSPEPICLHLHIEMLLGSATSRSLVIGAGSEVRTCDLEAFLKSKNGKDALKNILENDSIPKFCHGAKSLWHIFSDYGMELRGISFDIEIAYLLARSGAQDSSLPIIILQELGEEYHPQHAMPQERARIATYLARLHSLLRQKIDRQGLAAVFDTMEMPLIPILARMEQYGIRVDNRRIAALAERLENTLKHHEKNIYALAGIAFNINSVKELREVLFEKMQIGIKGLRKTAGGVVSTKASELEKLRGAHPVVEKILAYRELFKIKTTYLDTLPSLIRKDGRVHTTYMQLGAATGRMSSLDPNLQNIPVRGPLGKDMRSIFIAEKGWSLLAADYSQLELRIVAHLSKDRVMCDAFKRGDDIHARTASAIFGVEPRHITKDMRTQAKTLNFGVLYGMGAQAFAETAGIDLEKAKSFVQEYFREFASIKAYFDATKAQAEARGYAETLFGRRRYIPEIRSQNFAVRRSGERMAVNMPVQGTEADIVKLAMVHIKERLQKEGISDDARLLLQVHDELVFEVRDAILKKVARIVTDEMERAVTLDVPLVVECGAGKSWGKMSIVERES